MSLDKLGLINLALLQIKQKPLTGLDDTNNPVVNAANIIYPQKLRSLLRRISWNCARTLGTISLKTDYTPPFDWGGAYELPSDLVALRQVGTAWDQWAPDAMYQHEISARLLFYGDAGGTPPNSLYIVYTKDLQDVSQMDDLFIETFYLELAAELAMPVAGDPKIWAMADERAKIASAKAEAINRQERPIRIIDRNPISEARWSDSNWSGQTIVPDSAWPDA